MKLKACSLGIALSLACSISSCRSRVAPTTRARAAGSASAAFHPRLGPAPFTLVSAATGAVLVSSDSTRQQVWTTELDARGAPRTRSELVDARARTASTRIAEIVASAHGTELALAWLEVSPDGARTRGLVLSPTERRNAATVDIGSVEEPLAQRGNLVLASSEGRFVLLARAGKTRCVDAAETDCVAYGFHHLEPGDTSEPGPPLALPRPCGERALDFLVSEGHWYYALCSGGTGKPLTTLFSIDQKPAYARADRILNGCLPLGMLLDQTELLVVGDCAGDRRGARLRGRNAKVEDVRVDRLDLQCENGSPVIRQLSVGGIRVGLNTPRDGLEAFLPERYTLPRARAVWTGQALVVAGVVSEQLVLKSYECDSTLLREIATRRVDP